MEELLNGYFLQVLTFVCINIILAMTIYMTLCTGILSLGNAGLMSFGAYTSAILTAEYNFPMPIGILWRLHRDDRRTHHRSADYTSARALPCYRDAGLRRSRPRHRAESGHHSRRAWLLRYPVHGKCPCRLCE